MKSEYLYLQHGRLYIESKGKGNLILCIAGGPGCTFFSLKPYLSFLSTTNRIVFFDPIGVGKSSTKNNSYTISFLMDEILSIIKHFNVSQLTLIGHSFGGLIAQEFALTNPKYVNKLILICSSTGLQDIDSKNRFNEVLSIEEKQNIINITNKYKNNNRSYFFRYKLGFWKYHHYKKPSIFRLLNLKREYKCNSLYAENIEKEFKTVNYGNVFREFRIPIFILDSINDYVFPKTKIQYMISNHPNAESIIFNKSGHNPFIDEKRKFKKVMKKII